MDGFGIVQKEDVTSEDLSLEKKYDWVLFHPNGNLFIPAEFMLQFSYDKTFSQKKLFNKFIIQNAKNRKKVFVFFNEQKFTLFFQLYDKKI